VCQNNATSFSLKQVVIEYRDLKIPVLLQLPNSHKTFFGPTITTPTSTTKQHPFPQRDLILHQSSGFGSRGQELRGLLTYSCHNLNFFIYD